MKNKKRLIDANEIEELFYKQIEQGATDLRDAFDYALEDAQTVDAVEVVRCKDCRRARVCKVEYKVFCDKIAAYVGLNAFCSYGERKGR